MRAQKAQTLSSAELNIDNVRNLEIYNNFNSQEPQSSHTGQTAATPSPGSNQWKGPYRRRFLHVALQLAVKGLCLRMLLVVYLRFNAAHGLVERLAFNGGMRGYVQFPRPVGPGPRLGRKKKRGTYALAALILGYMEA